MTRSLLFSLLLAGFLWSGCDTQTPDSTPRIAAPEAAFLGGGGQPLSTEVLRDLAAARRATARFQQFDVGVAAGWNTDITNCRLHPTDGGMGHHFVNFGVADDQLNVEEPEVLLYEPQANGRMKLVAADYVLIVPQDTDPAPRFMEQEMYWNPEFQVWQIHAWIWQHNPSGVFANWNPTVTCEFADVVTYEPLP